MQTNFSNHAFMRLQERMSLSLSEVQEILDSNKYLLLYKDRRGNHHKLFFSKPDKSWFIAIQNEPTKAVVTVFQLNSFYKWNISAEALAQTQRLVEAGDEGSTTSVSKSQEKQKITDIPRTKAFRFYAILEGEDGKREVALNQIRCTEHNSLETIIVDPYIHRKMQCIVDSKLRFGERCIDIRVYIENKSASISIFPEAPP